MTTRSRAVGVAKYVGIIPLLCLGPALYIGQNASNGVQVSGPTDVFLRTAAVKTALTNMATGGMQDTVTVSTGTVGVLAPGWNLVLDRTNPGQETLAPFPRSGMPVGTCNNSAMLNPGTWCLRTDAQDTLSVYPANTHSSGAPVEQLGSVLIQFQPSGMSPTTTVQVDATTGSITTNGKLIFNNNSTGTASTAFTSSPSGLNTWTFQNATDTVVGLNTTDTLTNKTLSSPTVQHAYSHESLDHGHSHGPGEHEWSGAADGQGRQRPDCRPGRVAELVGHRAREGDPGRGRTIRLP